MNEFPQGSIILVDLTFSDQKQTRLRPALVISTTNYNRLSRDVIVLKIASKKPKFFFVSLDPSDLSSGKLDVQSYVQIDAIHSLEKSIIRDVIGTITHDRMLEIYKDLERLLTPSSLSSDQICTQDREELTPGHSDPA